MVFSVNVTLDSCSLIISLATLYGMIFEVKERTLKNKIFLGVISAVILGSFIDLLAYASFIKLGNVPFVKVLFCISFVIPNIWISLLVYYLVSFLKEKILITWNRAHIVAGLMVLNSIVDVVLYILGFIYKFDGDNIIYANFAAIRGIIFLLVLILYSITCIKYREDIGTHDSLALLVYMLYIVISYCVDIFVRGLGSHFFAEATSVFVCFVMVQHESMNDKNVRLDKASKLLEQNQFDIEEAYKTVKSQIAVINAFNSSCIASYVFDVNSGMYEELKTIEEVRNILNHKGDFEEEIGRYIENRVVPACQKSMSDFTNKSLLPQKLKDKNVTFIDFESKTRGWCRATWYALSRDENQNLKTAMYTVTDIDQEVREDMEQRNVIKSLARKYNSLYYIDLKDFSFSEIGTNFEKVHEIIGSTGDARDKFDAMCKYLCLDESKEEMREFVNLSNLNQRMKDKQWIAHQFQSAVNGWSEGCFIAGDRDEDGNLLHVIWATRDVNEMRDLMIKSHTDKLTGFYNRRAYEEDIAKYKNRELKDSFVYVSMDLNGLKITNDSKGHGAGDELLQGAAECIKQVFGPYGRLYRTGGDEFVAIIYADEDRVKMLEKDLEDCSAQWKGELIEGVTISCGYATKAEIGNAATVQDLAVLADERMYKAKSLYYKQKGFDRRGQKNAHIALCALYTKILKINLTEDSYQIVNIDESERDEKKGYSEKISEWLYGFTQTGQVHGDDIEEFSKYTNLPYLKEYFMQNKNSLNVFYRRKIDGEYKKVMMEIIPADDYTNENQSLFLYVKCIEN